MITVKDQEALHTKTVLEYLVMINEQSFSGIGRVLNITPQQFSDWVKKRRPIPQERLRALVNYFGVHETILVDSKQFVKPLTPVAKSELHMLLLDLKVAELEMEGARDEDIIPYLEKKKELQLERKDHLRLTRMAAVLGLRDERVGVLMDTILGELEAGRLDELSNKLKEIR